MLPGLRRVKIDMQHSSSGKSERTFSAMQIARPGRKRSLLTGETAYVRLFFIMDIIGQISMCSGLAFRAAVRIFFLVLLI